MYKVSATKLKANELKAKAIEILIKYKTTDMLQWLMDQNLSDFEDINVHFPRGKKDERNIDESICFENSGNRYELFYLDDHPVNDHSGKFCLYYNDELVIQTNYEKKSGEYMIFKKIRWSGVDILKLSDYVEDIPKIVVNEKMLRSKKATQLHEEIERIEAEKIYKNIDLGKYK